MKLDKYIFDAKILVRQQHSGVLSTHSQSVQGYPFGSVVPYFMTNEGNLVTYISQIAQHTRNIKGNPKVSVTIFDTLQDDSQANGRVTFLGDAELVEDAYLTEQYLALFPRAKGYKQTHDFSFYQIKPERIRYIGGFGKIFWINKEDWQSSEKSEDWPRVSKGIIEHMNEDHHDAMTLIVEHQFALRAKQVTMLSAFYEGCHIEADGKVLFLKFDKPCTSAQAVREQLVAATHAARADLTLAVAN
ncbi:pyridoxamine 5'-phosphate oxidase-related, FMN-binding protein [Paraglaciecola sp. T6c]|uniref:HugZ family pyridoxamine 5'-phosphate oxidase n=1 Tax=Pseudoalteromonas atlantica (strain T6c / ATCC BAA-1087) TaxID=3042615 RepID=UPI00005C5EB0|nr:DUF2470 domain-containing protein [Paraglaciecola sp. T6c]ABG40014.1 pyridoxamine 5'-phosphate oxidase-related, FMN-binding protein [Paraglaciecola sp. T6c]